MPGIWTQKTLTIPNGQTSSNEIDLEAVLARNAVHLLVQSPGTLTETVNPQVSIDGSAYVILQSGGTDIALPAGRGTQLQHITVRKFKVVATGAVGGERVFTVAVGVA